jgi:hypothetical protein
MATLDKTGYEVESGYHKPTVLRVAAGMIALSDPTMRTTPAAPAKGPYHTTITIQPMKSTARKMASIR